MWMFPKIGVPQKWMVYDGKPYEQMDDLGGKPTIFGNTHMFYVWYIYLPTFYHKDQLNKYRYVL